MSIDRPESAGPPMFDLTKDPGAHTYQLRKNPKPVGDPVITILAEQSYANGRVAEARIRVDLYILLQSKNAGEMLHRAALEALASIGVKL